MDVTRVVWELEQRRLIAEMLQEYCELVDRNDPHAIVHRVFAPDATFELDSRHVVTGRENLSRMFAATLAALTASSHHLSNLRITFDGDHRAESSAYSYAWNRSLAGDRLEFWGRWNDRLVLLGEGRRISNRRVSMAGSDGLNNPRFELTDRLPVPADPPAPVIERR